MIMLEKKIQIRNENKEIKFKSLSLYQNENQSQKIKDLGGAFKKEIKNYHE